jgi:hypothetical protein
LQQEICLELRGAPVDKTGGAIYNATSTQAGVAELADASDSKSDEEYLRKGSIPFSGIFIST